MANYTLASFWVVAGFFLVISLLSEDFHRWLFRLRVIVRRRPRLKYLVYPLGLVLGLMAAALIIKALALFSASPFSYD